MEKIQAGKVWFRDRERDVGRARWDWIGASLYYCKTLENGDEESMLVMTKTAHCIFLRERRLRVPTENREKALCARALALPSLSLLLLCKDTQPFLFNSCRPSFFRF